MTDAEQRALALVEVVTTVAREADALSLSHRVVEERLAACANIGQVRSVYRWEGEICDEHEYQIVFKTLEARAEALERRIGELHEYDTPAIVRLPVSSATPEYARWVRQCVTG